MAEWEAEIKIRRNGRLVNMERALGDTPSGALWFVTTQVEAWVADHPENDPKDGDL